MLNESLQYSTIVTKPVYIKDIPVGIIKDYKLMAAIQEMPYTRLMAEVLIKYARLNRQSTIKKALKNELHGDTKIIKKVGHERSSPQRDKLDMSESEEKTCSVQQTVEGKTQEKDELDKDLALQIQCTPLSVSKTE